MAALYAALDGARRSRGLSWRQVAEEISRLFARTPARPISPSTLTGMRSRGAIDGDGVLQMLRWLRRTPESFVPGRPGIPAPSVALPQPDLHQILRFDAPAIYSALNAQREEHGLTWTQVAAEIGGGGAASLTRLAKGGRIGIADVMRIAGWLGRPAATLTRLSDW